MITTEIKRLAAIRKSGEISRFPNADRHPDFATCSGMECWLITSRAEVLRLEFGDEPPPEICLPDRPLSEIEDDAAVRAIQDAQYIIYRRYHLAHESWRLGIVYSIAPPTVGDIQILSAYRAGHEARPRLA
ncbi:MAG TPA: hypothetical protein VGD02_11385 [Gemmatimonadaceae bacterium]|jgi:hypothetical protein